MDIEVIKIHSFQPIKIITPSNIKTKLQVISDIKTKYFHVVIAYSSHEW